MKFFGGDSSSKPNYDAVEAFNAISEAYNHKVNGISEEDLAEAARAAAQQVRESGMSPGEAISRFLGR